MTDENITWEQHARGSIPGPVVMIVVRDLLEYRLMASAVSSPPNTFVVTEENVLAGTLARELSSIRFDEVIVSGTCEHPWRVRGKLCNFLFEPGHTRFNCERYYERLGVKA